MIRGQSDDSISAGQELHFGLGDFVTVYPNDQAIYSGADNFI